eukprot:TRINITY_DN5446_c0_g1_i2.p1 TRINITY_DN5446_c0_g1~~TRINITY_DN5446_c0_g1_i2.p1  ORF type:complete len:652 (-),score=190.30 TRINITY_DN5446_c0_g1_i2:1438-3393(-)
MEHPNGLLPAQIPSEGSGYSINLCNVIGSSMSLNSLISSELIPFPSISPIEEGQKSFYADPIFRRDSEAIQKNPAGISSIQGTVASMIAETNASYVQLKPELQNLAVKAAPISPLREALLKNDLLNNKVQHGGVQPTISHNYVNVTGSPNGGNSAGKRPNEAVTNGRVTTSPLHSVENITPAVPNVTPMASRTKSTAESVTKKKKTQHPTEPEDPVAATLKRFRAHSAVILDQNDKENEPVEAAPLNISGTSDPNFFASFFLESSKMKSHHLFDKVEEDLLKRLLTALGEKVKEGTEITLPTPNPANTDELRKSMIALDSCLICLAILTSNGIPTTLYGEELIDNLVSLTRAQLTNNVFPAYDASQTEDLDDEVIMGSAEKKKGQRSVKKTNAKNVSVPVAFLHKISLVLEHLNYFAEKQTLTDELIIKLSSTGLPIFFIEGLNVLQLSTINLLRTLFSRYGKHRGLILDDIFESLTKLPKTKRNLRTFNLTEDKKSIQMVTALVLQLIQSCASLPSSKENKSDSENFEGAGSSFESAISCSKTFISSFMKRCSSKIHEADYRPILENLTADLLSAINLPEWPAAEMLLRIISHSLVGVLAPQANSGANAPEANSPLRLLAVELLGDILHKLKQEIKIAAIKVRSIIFFLW